MSNERKTFVESVLGKDALSLARMEGEERLSRPFCFTLDLLSERQAVDPHALLGSTMTVHLELPGDRVRHFHGHVASWSALGQVGRRQHYQATLRPWLWLLGHASDHRVFQRKTVPEIVKEVCAKHGFSELELALSDRYEPAEYRVQAGESDLAFVSRLLEAEGIYYYFQHGASRHTLVLADGPAAHAPTPGFATVRYAANHDDPMGAVIDRWATRHALVPGSHTLDDYDFEKPTTELRARLSAPKPHPQGRLEQFAYPGGYTTARAGERYARLRLEEAQVGHAQASGSGTARGIAPGKSFTLSGHPVASNDQAYLVTAASYALTVSDHEALGARSDAPFRCTFEAIRLDAQYRPLRLTPRPTAPGVQSAQVVGPPGEEIWTDRYGRVKVQFHWDREGRADEHSSCWVRVAQTWAGSGFGTQHVPRIGQEVLVDFLDGDPDRPVVIGSLYNGRCAAPFALPGQARVSGVKTDSSKDAVGSNELSFDDKRGAERVVLRGQRDLALSARGDGTLSVEGDLAQSAKKQLTIEAGTSLDLSASTELRLTVGLAEVVLTAAGIIKIRGLALNIDPACKIVLMPVV